MDNLRTIPWLSHMSKLSPYVPYRALPDQPNPWFFPSQRTPQRLAGLPNGQVDLLGTDKLISMVLLVYHDISMDWLNGKKPMVSGSDFPGKPIH